jgi:hypothetical protein
LNQANQQSNTKTTIMISFLNQKRPKQRAKRPKLFHDNVCSWARSIINAYFM